ncbi:MAG: hypothetical protein K9M56_01775 [Victivallales bacterium]|nr:hypothetical protein [Victivallales bacterium]
MMKKIITVLLVLQVFAAAGAVTFDRSLNPDLYDEVIQERKAEYLETFALNSSTSEAEEEEEVGYSNELADDAQETYSKPGFFEDQEEYDSVFFDSSFRWVGSEGSGYIESTSVNGEVIACHPPEDADYWSGEVSGSHSWDIGDTTYEIVTDNDGFVGIYERPPDNPFGDWAYLSYLPEDTYEDIPDAVKGYFHLVE